MSFHKKLKRLCFQCIVLLFLILLPQTRTQAQNGLPTIPPVLERLPIQENGRRKPYLVFAEETLLTLSGKSTLTLEGKKWNAASLITTFWLDPDSTLATEPLILISYGPLKEAIDLDPHQKLFSYDALSHNTKLSKLITDATQERKQEPRKRLQGLAKEAADVGMRLALFEELQTGSLFHIVPNEEAAGAPWTTLPGWEEAGLPGNPMMARQAFCSMQKNWNEQHAPNFTEAVDQLVAALATIEAPSPIPSWKLELEVIYQKAHPFRWAWILYAIAGILLFLSHRVEKKESQKQHSISYKISWFLAGSGFFLQIVGLLSRIFIAGRPPVTNMYESIIWVSFGTIFFALIFESIYHAGIFLMGAIPIAVASLILADSQPMILDPSIHPLTPVLRDNFWLTIHVLTITLSYAAFALSLGIAHVALTRVIFRKKVQAVLYNYLYRTLQIGILLLATGVILGGVWANYSWGRFWDWDPKETWALIALLGYLFLLHGRIAGRWSGFGLAIGAVLAFLSVLMAWYGVNFVLGAGLHSYGFGTGGFPFVIAFVSIELLFVAAAFFQKKNGPRSS